MLLKLMSEYNFQHKKDVHLEFFLSILRRYKLGILASYPNNIKYCGHIHSLVYLLNCAQFVENLNLVCCLPPNTSFVCRLSFNAEHRLARHCE